MARRGRAQHDAYFGIDGKRGRGITLAYGMGCYSILAKSQRHQWCLGIGILHGLEAKTKDGMNGGMDIEKVGSGPPRRHDLGLWLSRLVSVGSLWQHLSAPAPHN